MSKVLVVTELVSIVSEKVTETFDVIETEVSPSEGDVDETVGGVVSIVVVVSSVVVVLSLVVDAPSSLLLQEMMVRLKRDMRIMYKTLFIFSSIPKVKYYGLVVGEPYLYHNLVDLTIIGDFTWRATEC